MDTLSPIVTSAEAMMNAAWIVWWALWMAAAVWSDRAAKSPPLRSHILYRLFPVLGGALLLGRFGGPAGLLRLWRTPEVISWAMVAVAITGFAFTWWARLHLGRLWSSSVSRKADHRIVDTGPYGIVRHPIYTGIIIASVATAALRATAAAWIGVALLTIGWYVKARLEERFLREQLGPENYDAYARRVPMLIPFMR